MSITLAKYGLSLSESVVVTDRCQHYFIRTSNNVIYQKKLNSNLMHTLFGDPYPGAIKTLYIIDNDVVIKSQREDEDTEYHITAIHGDYLPITIICIDNCYAFFQDYIDSLIQNGWIHNVILYSGATDESLKIPDSDVLICMQTIPAFIPESRKNVYILNTEQLTAHKLYLDIIVKYRKQGRGYIDYNEDNIIELQNYDPRFNQPCYYLPYQISDFELSKLEKFETQNKIYDVGIVNVEGDHRKSIMRKLCKAGHSVIDIRGWLDERDKLIGSCKILLNVHYQSDYQIYESIRCDRLLLTGQLVVSEDCKISNPEDPTYQLVIFSSYDTLVSKVSEVLQNYEWYMDDLHHKIKLYKQSIRENKYQKGLSSLKSIAYLPLK